MKFSASWVRRQIAGCLMLLLAVPFLRAAALPPPQAVAGQSAAAPSSSTPAPKQKSGSTPGNLGNTPPSAPEPQQNGASTPVGTAAAPYEKTAGSAVSRPAGAVIAPAKQRRARSFLIKLGILVGAGVAIGTVVGLSTASPSRPH